jgi:hypothetical protein
MRFASLAKIPFVIAVSFFAVSSSNHKMLARSDHAPTESCDRQLGWLNSSRSTVRAMSKLMGCRESFQRLWSCNLYSTLLKTKA